MNRFFWENLVLIWVLFLVVPFAGLYLLKTILFGSRVLGGIKIELHRG